MVGLHAALLCVLTTPLVAIPHLVAGVGQFGKEGAMAWRDPKFDFHAGLQYGPGFRLCKKAYRTDTDAVGVVGPLPGEAVGWLVHPALADSMLHLTAVAPKPPEGGWPWMSDDEKNGVVPGVTD